MTDRTSKTESVLASLLARLRADGGRYLLSVTLTGEERAAEPAPSYGGKPTKRWLTDEEYAALCSIGSRDETPAEPWLPLGSMTTPPTGKYVVGHRGYQCITHYLNGADPWHPHTKIGWQDDPFAFGATHYMPLPAPEHVKTNCVDGREGHKAVQVSAPRESGLPASQREPPHCSTCSCGMQAP